MSNSESDTKESPKTKLQKAADNLETGKQHKDRAKELASESESQLKKELTTALPESTEVSVTAEIDCSHPQFIIQVWDDKIEQAVTDILEDYSEIGLAHPQQFTVGDNLPDGPDSQDQVENIRGIIADLEDRFGEGAHIDQVIRRMKGFGLTEKKIQEEIEELKQRGEVYEPRSGFLRTI